MIYIVENFWAILAATVAGYGFGALYYMGLAKPWMAAARLTEEDIKTRGSGPSWLPYGIAFVSEFWIASILAGALILAPEEAGAWAMALGTALIIWVGFVFPTMLVNHRYGLKPWSLTLIDGGHWLAVFIIQVVVLELIGLSPPGAA